MAGGRGDRYLLLVAGANHFSIVDPVDATTGTAFLDFPATQPAAQIRALIADAVGLFIEGVNGRSTAPSSQDDAIQPLNRLLMSDNSAIAAWEQK